LREKVGESWVAVALSCAPGPWWIGSGRAAVCGGIHRVECRRSDGMRSLWLKMVGSISFSCLIKISTGGGGLVNVCAGLVRRTRL
jgi:hypothetical protein